MDIDQLLLVLVNAIHSKADSMSATLIGYDFAYMKAGRRSRCTHSSVHAVSDTGAVAVGDTSLGYVHRPHRGWMLETRVPEAYPSPPFLLSEDATFKSVYHGIVRLQPLASMNRVVLAEITNRGEFRVPVTGGGWLGELIIESEDLQFGRVIAFSNTIAALPGECHVVLADDDEEFGRICLL